VWVDQVNWKIFPNLSTLLVGPSGVGKDTAIDAAERIIQQVGGVTIMGGRTIETIYDQLLKLGDPACAYIPAPELTAFLGSKDYQQSMMQELTDLLSTKESKDVSSKSAGKQVIKRPTLTMQTGSTEEWLHKAMPDGSLEGGWTPRFLIIAEQYGSRSIPLIKLLPKSEVQQALTAHDTFITFMKDLVGRKRRYPREVTITNEAAETYENWYRNRFRLFSRVVQPYANRSRDQVLRVAMLCALTRNHDYIERPDMDFAVALMQYVAERIDGVMKPPTMDARLGREIVKVLPASATAIIAQFGHAYQRRDLISSLQYLVASGQVNYDNPTTIYSLKEQENPQ
jgi:energy-coupling factor transporter ATP-binding protein EcfA2